MKLEHQGLWKIASPEKEPPPETAGLDKDEIDFVCRYLALADELLKPRPALPKKAA